MAITGGGAFYLRPYFHSLRTIAFSPDLIACYQTNTPHSNLRIYNRNGEGVFFFEKSFNPHIIFSPTAGELVTIEEGKTDKAYLWKNFESKEPVSEVLPGMKLLSSECGGHHDESYIPYERKPIHVAPDGTWYFSTKKFGRDAIKKNELKQFDGSKIISIAELQEPFDLMAWNQNNDIIGLCRNALYKIKAGIVKKLQLNRLGLFGLLSLTSLPDYLVAVHSSFGIEIIDTQNEMKSIGEKELTNISTLLTNPDTGELIVVFNDGRINIFAVNKTPEGQVEFIETGSFDSKLTDIRTAEWNPYTHSVLVMGIEGFKEIDLGHVKKIRAQISTHLINPFTEITMQFLGFFKPLKPTSQAEVDEPKLVSADWSDLSEWPKK